MEASFTLAGLAIGAFLATNLDNLLLLIFLQGANPRHRKAVVTGYLLAVGGLIALVIAGSRLGDELDPGIIGYLGLIPIALGLWLLRRSPAIQVATEGSRAEASAPHFEGSVVLGTTVLLLSNSGDSLALLLPLLADTYAGGRKVLLLTWLSCAGLWVFLGQLLTQRPSAARVLEQHGTKVVPWVMIGVGAYILLNTATDRLGIAP